MYYLVMCITVMVRSCINMTRLKFMTQSKYFCYTGWNSLHILYRYFYSSDTSYRYLYSSLQISIFQWYLSKGNLMYATYVSLLYFHRVFKKASPNGKVIYHVNFVPPSCPLLFRIWYFKGFLSVSTAYSLIWNGYVLTTTNIEQQRISCSKIWFDSCDGKTRLMGTSSKRLCG